MPRANSRRRLAVALPARRLPLPQTFRGTAVQRVTWVMMGLFLLAVAGGFAYGLWAADDLGLLTIAVMVPLTALMAPAACLVIDCGLTRVTVHEDGIEVRRLLRSSWLPWDRISRIEVSATPRTRVRDLAGDSAGIAGTLTVMAVDALSDEPSEDPLRQRRVRGRYDPSAVLRDARGRRLAALGRPLWWPLFDVLFAEAADRGIEIRRTA